MRTIIRPKSPNAYKLFLARMGIVGNVCQLFVKADPVADIFLRLMISSANFRLEFRAES